MPRHRTVVPGFLAVLLAVLLVLVAFPINVVSGYIPAGVTRHRLAWIVLLVVLVLAIGLLTWRARASSGKDGDAWISLVPAVHGWVDREELSDVVSALTARSSGAVALTTGLVGAGGFGKTTLAAKACQERKVRRRFPGGIVWLTVGRDTDGPGLAARISEMIAAGTSSGGPPFANPEQAGHALAGVLAGRGQSLLVLDDVWTASQLEPFGSADQPWKLLVTTRRPAVLDSLAAHRIQVDAMPDPVARQLLARGLPVVPAIREREILDLTGRWPLLLNLVNHRLADDVDRGADIDTAAAAAADRLRLGGPAALDITDSGQRQTAAAATVEYSLDLMTAEDRDRFFDLGIFAEDAEIPIKTAAMLWQNTTGLGEIESQLLCERLDGLSLLTLAWSGETRIWVIHDVIRDFVLSRLGPAGVAVAHTALVNAAQALLPYDDHDPMGWWRLPETADLAYIWAYLTYHLAGAHLAVELDAVCCDLRFLAIRLRRSGPAAIETDLARSSSPTAGRLRRAVAQNAHLMGPIEPEDALITTFTSRLGGVPEIADQLRALRSGLRVWTAWPTWLPPDQPSDALIRVLISHVGAVRAVAISLDGTWLASASGDRTARTWDADGTPRAVLAGHEGPVLAVAISPDGAWLATGSEDVTVRLWDADSTPRIVFTGHRGRVRAVAISPDGAWLASASEDWTARIWGADGTRRAVLAGHEGRVLAVAISPDGAWLATGSEDGTVRAWDADGTPRKSLTGPQSSVRALAISPDGTWLAATSGDRTVRAWDADGTPRAVFTGHQGRVEAVAISPDGAWLATGSRERTVRTWDADGTPRAVFTGHQNWVNTVAISPDGAWLATGSRDWTVRTWVAVEIGTARLTSGQGSVRTVAISPDGTWLATGGGDWTVRTWDTDGTPRAVFTGHQGRVNTVAISSDGTWLASGGDDRTVRAWDVDGALRTSFSGSLGSIRTVAISSDGTWLATGSDDDRKVRIWTADGTIRTTFTAEQGRVDAIAISPDGTWLATANGDGSARIWEVGGTCSAVLTGHHGPVRAVAISPDGSWLATGGDDRTVRLRAANGTCRAVLTGHQGPVLTIAISSDGSLLATGGEDRTVRIWFPNGSSLSCATAVRVDGRVSACVWFAGSTNLRVATNQGLYGFSLTPPSADRDLKPLPKAEGSANLP